MYGCLYVVNDCFLQKELESTPVSSDFAMIIFPLLDNVCHLELMYVGQDFNILFGPSPDYVKDYY